MDLPDVSSDRLEKLAALGDESAAQALDRLRRRGNTESLGLRAHRDPIYRVELSPSGDYALSRPQPPWDQVAHGARDTLIWHVRDGHVALRVPEDSRVLSLTDDGRALIAEGERGERRVAVIHLNSGATEVVASHRYEAYGARIEKDVLVVETKFDRQRLALPSGQALEVEKIRGLEPDLHGPPRFHSVRGMLFLEPASGETPARLRGPEGELLLELLEGEHAIAQDGRRLLYGDERGELVLYDLLTLEVERRFVDPEAFPEAPFLPALERRRRARAQPRPEWSPEALRAIRTRFRDHLWTLAQRCLELGLPVAVEIPSKRLHTRDGWRLQAAVRGVLGWRTRGSVIALPPGLEKEPRPFAEALAGDESPESFVEAAILYRELEHFGESRATNWRSEDFVGDDHRAFFETREDVEAVLRSGTDATFERILELELRRRGIPYVHPLVEEADWSSRVWLDASGAHVRLITLRADRSRSIDLEHTYILHQDTFDDRDYARYTTRETQLAIMR